jgi:glycine hydroxymethyltransferase
MAVFPGNQGGPLEHVIAAKAIAFQECLQPTFKNYCNNVLKNAKAMSNELERLDYKIISNGTDNHLVLIDLRNKNITGKDAELALVKSNITTNKNMVPFDNKSPFITSGIRLGTAAVTTRGLKEDDMKKIVNLIDRSLNNPLDSSKLRSISKEVYDFMNNRPLFTT